MHNDVHKALADNKTFIEKQDEKLDGIVLTKVQHKLEFMLQKYDAVAQGFKKFFNSEEMFRVLGEAVN